MGPISGGEEKIPKSLILLGSGASKWQVSVNMHFLGKEIEAVRNLKKSSLLRLECIHEVPKGLAISADFDLVIWRGDLRICILTCFLVIQMLCFALGSVLEFHLGTEGVREKLTRQGSLPVSPGSETVHLPIKTLPKLLQDGSNMKHNHLLDVVAIGPKEPDCQVWFLAE